MLSSRAQGGTLIRLYYKTAAGKKKVPFAKFGKFTINFFEPPKRERCKARERKQDIGPEGPQRAQEPRCREEVERGAAERAEKHEEAHFSAADAQGKEKYAEREQYAVERIERGGEERVMPAVQPQRAQQIVKEGERRTQQERGEKALSLHG